MSIISNPHEKIISAYQLLQGEVISVATFEHIRTILKGLHPKIDKKLETCSQALDKLQKMQEGDVITLSAERLSEDTEEKRKRKKALLFFISSIKDLKSELKRVESEFAKTDKDGNSSHNQLTTWARIFRFAKGPFGIFTLIALVIFGFLLLLGHKTQNTSAEKTIISISPTIVPNNSAKIQVIPYNGRQIPLSQLYIGRGSDCDSPHYHAISGRVTTIDKIVIPDPENCGYGKIKDVKITEVNAP